MSDCCFPARSLLTLAQLCAHLVLGCYFSTAAQTLHSTQRKVTQITATGFYFRLFFYFIFDTCSFLAGFSVWESGRMKKEKKQVELRRDKNEVCSGGLAGDSSVLSQRASTHKLEVQQTFDSPQSSPLSSLSLFVVWQ